MIGELRRGSATPHRWARVLVIGACALAASAGSAGEAVKAAAPAAAAAAAIPAFPSGFDWPANPKGIEAGIARSDWPALRKHAWNLWAGINTSGADGKPLWWSWPTSTAAFLDPNAAPASAPAPVVKLKHRGVTSASLQRKSPVYPAPVVDGEACKTGAPGPDPAPMPDGAQFQSNGDIMIAGVIYNREAYDWIRSQSLYKAGTLMTQLKGGAKEIAPFPANAIVLKHMYWPARGDGPTALPVWHAEKYPAKSDSYIGYEYWQDAVAIDVSGKPVPKNSYVEVEYLHHIMQHDGTTPLGVARRKARRVSINDFYHHRIDASELKRMSADDRNILNASACWLYNRPFKEGDYLVSVAMHLITKEVPNWALQSFWWSDRPDQGAFAADRPAISERKAPGPWRHYLLTLDYGIESKPGMLPVAFNPYIELAAGHPIETSCRNCHTCAAWPRGFPPLSPPMTPSAAYQTKNDPGRLVDLQPNNAIFKQLMRLDFQWAVSDRAVVEKPSQ